MREMKRALYIDGHLPTRILRDGPALRVRRANTADRLFPFSRLSRVVVNGQPEWDTAALLGCAEQGVVVIFVGADGQVRASLLGPVREDATHGLFELLAEILESQTGLQVYRDWMTGMDQQARRDLVREHGKHTWPIDAESLRRRYAQRTLEHTSSTDFDGFAKAIDSMLQAFVLDKLEVMGLQLAAPSMVATRVDMTGDLAGILAWRLLPERLGYVRRLGRAAARANRAHARLNRADAARFFEHCATDLGETLDTMLRKLHVRLIEVSRTYGGH